MSGCGAGGAAGGEFLGSGNGAQFPAGEHGFKQIDQFVVDEAVGGEDFAAVELEVIAGEIGHAASGFFHKQNAGRGVPGVEIELPKALETASGNVSQVERSRAHAANAVGAQGEFVVEVDVGIFVALAAGETGGDEGFG